MHPELLLIGLSHQTASLALREKLNVPDDALAAELQRIGKSGALTECVLLSTCNRVEIVGVAFDLQAATQALQAYFAARAGATDDVSHCLYAKTGSHAIRHLFRVTAGLEAMAVGEPQILGQVKDAFSTAQTAGTVGPLLSRCFDRAFAVAKRVRHETGIAQGRVSVSSIACDLAEQSLGDLKGRKVLLVGAGKMSLESARTLTSHGAELLVVNRTVERARELAVLSGATPQLLESLSDGLVLADVVISSTSNPGFVVTLEAIERAMGERQERPLFIIDIAVPRDVDPRVAAVEGVFLYNIDDLQDVSKQNLAQRQQEIPAAEQIIDAALDQFRKWQSSLRLTPTIVALREQFRSVMLAERERALARLGELGEKEREVVEGMGEAIVNKLLHAPLTELKHGCDGSDRSDLIDAVQRLFRLAVSNAYEEPVVCDDEDEPIAPELSETGAARTRSVAVGSAYRLDSGTSVQRATVPARKRRA